MKKSKKILISIALVFLSILLIVGSVFFLTRHFLKLQDVYVANVSIPERNLIEEEYLDVIQVPTYFLSDEVILDKNEIIGKYVKLNAYIPKGSYIYKEVLEDKDQMIDGLHFDLNKDEATYDLFVRDIKVNPAHLLKGMNVDLYLTVNRKDIISDLLISGARITGLYDVNNKEIKNNNDNSTLGTISIALKEEMIPYVNKAIAIGEVNLVVSSNVYDNQDMYMNKSSKVFELLS